MPIYYCSEMKMIEQHEEVVENWMNLMNIELVKYQQEKKQLY